MPISLIIPGRNCAATIGACLDAVVPMLERPETGLAEIVFVDDASTDDTRAIVERYPITVLDAPRRGAGAARNAGWRATQSELIWFVDSDCVAAPDALVKLRPHLDDEQVAGVSGTYGNAVASSRLACLIHEEIVQRHHAMPEDVDFLATFNVLYRRDVLEQIGGFDERYLKAQDAELAFRVLEAGHRLRFEIGSVVEHHHEQSWLRYLDVQRQQGYWRVFLHLEHRGHAAGNAYSDVLDHAQPPLAMLTVASLALIAVPWGWTAPVALAALLGLMQLPMTLRLIARTRDGRYLAFAFMSFLRAFWRGVGMTQGTLAYPLRRRRPDRS